MNEPKAKTEILQDLLNNDAVFLPPETTLETRFDEDLGLDSFDLVEMTIKVEKQFSISLDDITLEELKTVDNLVTEIESKLNKEIV